MAVQMTNEQLQQLIAAIQPQQPQRQQKSAAVLGHIKTLDLGCEKMRKLKKFNEWLEEAENRMVYIGANTDEEKVTLLRSWGGTDFVNFMKLNAKVLFEPTRAVLEPEGEEQEVPKDTYDEIIVKIRKELHGYVNRTLAMHQLLTTKQGTRPWMDFYADLEEKASNLDFDQTRYTHKDAIKDALIMGMTDKKLMERALTEDPDHDTLMRWGTAREAGKEGVHHLSGTYATTNRIGTNKDDDSMSENEIDQMMEQLTVMKIKKQGKYSARSMKSNANRYQSGNNQCRNCNLDHPVGRCPANGKQCYTCNGPNHFSRSEACPNTKRPIRRMYYNRDTFMPYQPDDMAEDYASTVMEASGPKMISVVGRLQSSKRKEVTVKIGGIPQTLFTDTGSDFTIIPPSVYQCEMGKLLPTDTKLRAWGSNSFLDVRGMVHTKLETELGAAVETKLYVVDGFKPEPLLGDIDAEALGFIVFNKDGRPPTRSEKEHFKVMRNYSIPGKIRQSLDVEVVTNRPTSTNITENCIEQTMQLVELYKGSVFPEGKVGKVDCTPVSLPIDQNFKPNQPPFRNVPIHYQEKVSNLLQFLRENDVITDVDPKEINNCIMNVVITDKSNGEIRMNIDNTPLNPGMQRTKYHIQTPQEIRHELKEAKIFTEMDMGYGYHQIPIDQDTQKHAVFQTHEGIHRMKRLYFGPTAATGVFHNEIRKVFAGIKGVTTIHDNILVTGKSEEDHYNNLKDCLERCKERGIILKLSKSTFCKNEVQWFGRTFTPYGVAADKTKINLIKEKGRPESTEDVRSLLMACQYNAKFAFDNPEVPDSYEQITAPLRQLLCKGTKFQWGKEEELSYQKLINVMSSETTLRPYDPKKKTHFVADASPVGIQASIYQEDKTGNWYPVDHLSRALTTTEQKYSPIEKESLAQSWGMNQLRYYLLGSTFTSWSDHKPLIPLYNNHQAPTSKRIARHRDKIQDLKYTMHYLPGKENPCDYGSRHPLPIKHLHEIDKTKMDLDTGDEIFIKKITFNDSPDAITTEDIKKAAENDHTYTKLLECIQTGRSGNKEIKEAGYQKIWQELCVIDNIIYKSDKIVIPDAEIYPGSGNIRSWILDIAHEGHQGATAMKRYLRALAWFPCMDTAIERRVGECLACQASTQTNHRDPLIPSKPPTLPWEKLSADHWGPMPDGKHLLVVIDELSRYPEVAIVRGTSADANIPALDEIFSRHGFCKRIKTDGGPPFNGHENHSLQQYFKWAGIKHKTTVSAEDPEANGLAEAFMKHCAKIYHTALIERKSPEAELNKHLRMYRATPHPTTGKPPALLLFGRNIKTRIDTKNTLNITLDRQQDITEAREHDIKEKQRQKQYKDNVAYAKPHQIQTGDNLLLAQKKTKIKPPYNPKPYVATSVHGHQITASRNDKVVTRDAQKWKRIQTKHPTNYDQIRAREYQYVTEDDYDYLPAAPQARQQPFNRNAVNPNNAQPDEPAQNNYEQPQEEPPPPRLYPSRERRRPDYYVAKMEDDIIERAKRNIQRLRRRKC